MLFLILMKNRDMAPRLNTPAKNFAQYINSVSVFHPRMINPTHTKDTTNRMALIELSLIAPPLPAGKFGGQTW